MSHALAKVVCTSAAIAHAEAETFHTPVGIVHIVVMIAWITTTKANMLHEIFSTDAVTSHRVAKTAHMLDTQAHAKDVIAHIVAIIAHIVSVTSHIDHMSSYIETVMYHTHAF